MKKVYVTPFVKKKVDLQPERSLMVASVVTKKTTVETTAQQVENKDFSDPGFNSTWE